MWGMRSLPRLPCTFIDPGDRDVQYTCCLRHIHQFAIPLISRHTCPLLPPTQILKLWRCPSRCPTSAHVPVTCTRFMPPICIACVPPRPAHVPTHCPRTPTYGDVHPVSCAHLHRVYAPCTAHARPRTGDVHPFHAPHLHHVYAPCTAHVRPRTGDVHPVSCAHLHHVYAPLHCPCTPTYR